MREVVMDRIEAAIFALALALCSTFTLIAAPLA